MKKLVTVTAAALSLAAPVPSPAADTPTAAMPEVVVTATRTENTIDRVGGSDVTVITREEIENKNPATLAEILKTVPGLDLQSNGGKGSQTSIFMRGADNKNTLVLVDGIMYNDPSSANRGANIGSLTLDNVERIEIIRGPMSVLYGSNATAGVINIITRKGEGRPVVRAAAEAGSENSWKLSAGSSGRVGRLDYSISAEKSATGGFSTADDDNDRIAHAGNTSEKDGWDGLTLSTRIGYDFTPDFRVETVIRHIDSTVDLDDYNYFTGALGDRFNPSTYAPEPNGNKDKHTDNKQCLARLAFHNEFLDDRLTSDLAVQSSRLDRDSFDNDGRKSYDYTGTAREATWQASARMFDSNLITAGTGYLKEGMDSDSSAINDKTAETVSFWLQDQLMLGDALDLIAGVRNDHHDRFGSKTTFRIAPALHLGTTTVRASYATGFRAPSLYELYSAYGNENLGAEKSEGYEAGVEQKLMDGKLRFSLTWFALDFEDRIDYDFVLWKYAQQSGTTRTRGLEFTADAAITDDLGLRVSWTYTDTEDPEGKRLARRPLNKASLGATYRLGEKGAIDCDAVWTGERDTISSARDQNGNRVYTLDSYTVVNLAARYEVVDQVEVYGRVENLFDEYYEEAWSYATPGLSAFAGVKVSY